MVHDFVQYLSPKFWNLCCVNKNMNPFFSPPGTPSNTFTSRPIHRMAQHSTSFEQTLRDTLTLHMSTHILTQKHTTGIHPPQHLLEILEFRVYHL